MAISVSSSLSMLDIFPVPSGTSVHCKSIPLSSTYPSAMAKCQGRLKFSGTPAILTVIIFIFSYSCYNRHKELIVWGGKYIHQSITDNLKNIKFYPGCIQLNFSRLLQGF